MNNIVDILYGASATYTYKKSNINNLIIEFDTIFSIANLDNIDNFKLTYPHELFDDYDFSKEMNLLDSLIKDKRVRIWCSRKDADSYILLCYLCNYLKNKTDNISVIYSEEYKQIYNTPAILIEEEFRNALAYEHKLSYEEINKLSNNFDYVKENNCEIRIMKNNEISLESFDYYNDIIINLLKGKNLKVSALVGEILSNYDRLSDIIYCYLVQRLIDKDIIKIVEKNDRFFDNVITLK